MQLWQYMGMMSRKNNIIELLAENNAIKECPKGHVSVKLEWIVVAMVISFSCHLFCSRVAIRS